jgi:penicillin amidase
VHPGSFSIKKPFEQRFGPTYRQIVDLADDGGAFLQTTGQSGHFLSPRYDDYLPDWGAGRYRSMRLRRAAVDASVEATLRLLPATGAP